MDTCRENDWKNLSKDCSGAETTAIAISILDKELNRNRSVVSGSGEKLRGKCPSVWWSRYMNLDLLLYTFSAQAFVTLQKSAIETLKRGFQQLQAPYNECEEEN
ncbi:hypothetical protein ABEB36_005020 [Hypothenemus hampei]|uniref:Uncharacterized protein n=1 Tax=Hypothenemus hampei TaxID=57062 RepID=A0ABD1EWN9_HYPHA